MIYELWDLRSNNLINSYEQRMKSDGSFEKRSPSDGEFAVEWLMVVEDDPDSDYFRRIGIGSELLAYIRDAA